MSADDPKNPESIESDPEPDTGLDVTETGSQPSALALDAG